MDRPPRRASRLVGRVVEEHGVMVVAPDDRRLHQDVLIPPDARNGARAGQIEVAEITEPPTLQRGPIGRILSILGERLQPSLVVEMAIASHDLPHEWPALALREAADVEPKVGKAEHAGRVDLRGVPLVTIDGADARVFDDAVYAEPVRDGWRLIVAIADVSHYVQPETALDGEAYARGTSAYFPGFVVPMLPETLSNGICSLNPEVERLCMVCEMQVDARGEVSRSKFYPGLMRSHARLTYERVWQAIGEGDRDARRELAGVLPQLEHLHALYRSLAKARRRRGSIDFDTQEVKYRLDPKGEVVALGATERNDAHRLIEECMIAANVQAARFLTKKKIPALYRVHAPPPAAKYEDLLEFLREYKLKMPPIEKVTPEDFSALLAKTRDRADAGLIQSVLLRAQSLASYQPENHGHFGLALEAYAHFTSPIRRYPDLLVHRAIKHALGGGNADLYLYSAHEMATLSLQCSERSRRADEAQREVDERYRAAWMEQHVGREFAGTISGVTSFGLFVELDDSKVNGLVHVTQLPKDFYHFDPIRKTLTGERRGREYRLGDRVEIVVLKASVEDRRIDFRLVEEPGTTAEAPPPPRGKPAKRKKQKY
jgi:ribonuclease R